ncbi:MAG: hypothetical protein KDB00_27720 [Planctomycetales bacterium]|nr:hypothetical protein [Planctomycetales bacterium]
MIGQVQEITLQEWKTKDPSNCEELRDRFLDRSVVTESVLTTLSESKLLEIVELRTGLRISAFSHVGRIQIGDLQITILPKIRGASFLNLLRYQLVIYALSQSANPQSTILYPTLTPNARPARVEVTDPINATPIGQVWIRPVQLDRIETLINDESATAHDKRKAFAHELAFGLPQLSNRAK